VYARNESFDNKKIISVENPHQELLHWINKHQIQITSKRENKIDIILDDNLFIQFQDFNLKYDIVSTPENRLRNIEGYRDYQTLVAELEQLSINYPDIVELISLGNSTCYDYFLEGKTAYEDFQHEIWCVKLSDNVHINEDEPNIYYAGGIHAREPISVEVTMNLLNYLVSNYATVDSIANWINNTQIWFVPLINPDGHKLVIDGTHTMHRKNMRDNNENNLPDFSTDDGVDLNRNFGYVWGSNGTSNYTWSNIYNGEHAWSESEIIYLRNLLQSHKFYAGITYHSYGEYVLYPLGHLPNCCSFDHEVMGELANSMANLIAKQNGAGYYTALQAVDFGYTCQGTMGDWGYSEERIFSFTIELANSFIPPASAIPQICDENLDASLVMLDRINHSVVTGHITNSVGEPISADVIVHEIDFSSNMSSVEYSKSDSLFGRYYRMLLPGNYSFTFQKEGYLSQTIENVSVTENEPTELNIVLSNAEYIEACLIDISIENETLFLEWEYDALSNYSVYSSENPHGIFLEDTSGRFISENRWSTPINSVRKFFKVRRIIAQ
jgi:murein tripeptide amidase MpaA